LRIAHEAGGCAAYPRSAWTLIAARMICELVAAGARIGNTANSHRVIVKLLDETLQVTEEWGLPTECHCAWYLPLRAARCLMRSVRPARPLRVRRGCGQARSAKSGRPPFRRRSGADVARERARDFPRRYDVAVGSRVSVGGCSWTGTQRIAAVAGCS
jgi:hypothetical protein